MKQAEDKKKKKKPASSGEGFSSSWLLPFQCLRSSLERVFRNCTPLARPRDWPATSLKFGEEGRREAITQLAKTQA